MLGAEEVDQPGENRPAEVGVGVARYAPERHEEHYRDGKIGEHLRARAEERARDVAAVELAGREQVERGHQQAGPAGERHRVNQVVVAQRHELLGERPEQVERQRRPEENQVARVDRRFARRLLGEPEAEQRDGQCRKEAGDGTAGTDVEQRAAVGYWLADGDEGAHRPEQQRRRDGDEEGQRRVEVVLARVDVVAHLVDAEDGQQR